ncbi:MAG: hypothetical protein DMG67_00690 [Acidobacteria bacterium]|nr:MAG: hypothetical protein DMG67_00690 [Acidobacteriota bacterium]
MSAFTFSPALIRNCRRCSRELAPGALVCQNCQALVYADEIDRLASQAKRLESKGENMNGCSKKGLRRRKRPALRANGQSGWRPWVLLQLFWPSSRDCCSFSSN